MSKFENLKMILRAIPIFLLTIHHSLLTIAQTPNQVINTVNERFEKDQRLQGGCEGGM
jgi:hypothetical protein